MFGTVSKSNGECTRNSCRFRDKTRVEKSAKSGEGGGMIYSRGGVADKCVHL